MLERVSSLNWWRGDPYFVDDLLWDSGIIIVSASRWMGCFIVWVFGSVVGTRTQPARIGYLSHELGDLDGEGIRRSCLLPLNAEHRHGGYWAREARG